MMSNREVKEYLSHHHLPQLLESLLTGLLYHRPEDPVSFLQSCLITTRQLGGPEAVTWDTFIHVERPHLSPQPPRTTFESLRATSIPPKVSVLSTATPIPPKTSALSPRTTSIPPIPLLPQIKSQTHRTASLIPPKTTLTPATPPIPHITPITALTPQKTTTLPPIKPQTTTPKLQTLPQIIPPVAPTSTSLTHSGLQIPSIKPKTSVLPALAPLLSSINNEAPSGVLQTTPDPKLLPPAPPGLIVTPQLVHTERREQRDTKMSSTETPPPSPVQSQLSIDSDSDMTESSGLLQEVSILPPQRSCPLIIFIIGGPGSGKASQAARLAHCFNLKVISLDELLRRQMLFHASPSRKWEIVSEMMSHGELGPQEETISELRRQLSGQPGVRGFIVDGFPRNVHQALSFQEQLGSPDLVMLLLCSNETLRCRLQRRATQLGLLGDSSHALRRRLEAFQRDIISISRYYRQLHLLTQVDADRDEEVVFADLKSVAGAKLLRKNLSGPADIPECSSAGSTVTSDVRSIDQ